MERRASWTGVGVATLAVAVALLGTVWTARDETAGDAVAVVDGRAPDRVVVRRADAPPIARPPAGTVIRAPGAEAVDRRRDRPLVDRLVRRVDADRDAPMMAGLMTAQPRADASAAPVEQAMREAFAHLPALAGAAEAPRVTCVATTCEVSGTAPAGNTARDVERVLRTPALLDAMVARGYTPGPVALGPAGPDGRVGFVLYLNNEL